jgi:M6 family metalloprotease-like protein
MFRYGILVLFVMVLTTSLWGVHVSNQPMTVNQPDGTSVQCLVSGDEFYNYLHDSDGYTIIRSQDDGFLYYAVHQGDAIVPSPYRVGTVDPRVAGLEPRVMISREEYNARRVRFYTPGNAVRIQRPTEGRMNNLSILISFSDQTEYTNNRQTFDDTFNSLDPARESLQGYYWTVSYNSLTIHTYLYPECQPNTNLSYHDSHPRTYYCAYNAVTAPDGYQTDDDRTSREHVLLASAVAAIADQVPDTLNIDANNDGKVDNVSFIIRGGNEGWAELLWGHRWYLFSQQAIINDKQVWDYTFVPESQSDTYTHCHEMFHSLGAPDLYHYNGGIDPVGAWDLMDGGFVHMSSYMKYRYGHWIDDIPEITESGLYTLRPLTEPTGNCYRIPSPNSNTEYFVVEYRRGGAHTYEVQLPSPGLVVYRIDSTCDGDGNAGGPPDEIYAYRPGGDLDSPGDLNQAAFSVDYGRSEFDSETNPTCFLSDGTDGEIYLHQIGTCGDSLTFYFNPQTGFITGTLTTDNPEDDLTQAIVNINGYDLHPNSLGQFDYFTDEGNYLVTASMPFHTSQTAQVLILPMQESTTNFHLLSLLAPTDLQVTVDGNSAIFTWDYEGAQEGFTGFNLYRKVVGHNWTRITNTTEQTYTVQVLHTVDYRFFVNAQYENGISDSTNVIELNFTGNGDPVVSTLRTELAGNSPNPFNPDTVVRYSLATDSHVRLSVYDLRGRLVNELRNETQAPGTYSLNWHGNDDQGRILPSGVYFLRMEANGRNVGTRKMLLLK